MGKKAIVVGASSGIGKQLAIGLVQLGYTVGITGRREELLDEMARLHPDTMIPYSFDCISEQVLDHLEVLVQKLGGLDLYIHSSGTGDLNESLDYTVEERTNSLNVAAFTKTIGWAYKYFQRQGHGHLVGISSIGGLRGSGVAPAYNASKAYQINYLEGLRQKSKKSNVPLVITDVRPGFVDTDMAKGDGQFWVATPTKAAKQIIRAILRKKERVYVTKRWTIFAIILKILPNWIYKRL
nr:SDR family NAD(P)-dependent oxidoreductase [Allomuricauda sp.]